VDVESEPTGSVVVGAAHGSDAVVSGLVRLRVRRGCVGERARVVHLALIPDGLDESGEVLWTLCDSGIRRGEAERVFGIVGMPCEPCLARLTRLHALGEAPQDLPAVETGRRKAGGSVSQGP
jgi:hypothetical protein